MQRLAQATSMNYCIKSLAVRHKLIHDRNTFFRGLQEFNQEAFFEAHETLEDVWREAVGCQKPFLQALIQASVAFHHFTQGNAVGTRSLLGKSAQTLTDYPDIFGGIDVLALRQSIAEWQRALAENLMPPAFPKLQPPSETPD